MERTERGGRRGFVSRPTRPARVFSRYTFGQKLAGVLRGTASTLSDFRNNKAYKQAIILYVSFFLANVALMFLFTYLFFPAVFEVFLSDFIWYLPLFVFIQLVFWLLRIVIYHVFCKIAGGTATIGTAFSASAFLYPINSLFLLVLILLAFFVKLQQFLLFYIPLLLLLALFIWRAIVLIRYASTIHNLSKDRAFFAFLALSVVLALVVIAVYFGISAYLDYLRETITAAGVGV